MRRKLEASHARTHLKRGFGGLADIEFLVQYLQLVHAAELPEILRPNLWDALDALRRVRLLDAEVHADLRDAYDFLRTVESRLRIVHNRSGSRPSPTTRRARSPGPPAQLRGGRLRRHDRRLPRRLPPATPTAPAPLPAGCRPCAGETND